MILKSRAAGLSSSRSGETPQRHLANSKWHGLKDESRTSRNYIFFSAFFFFFFFFAMAAILCEG